MDPKKIITVSLLFITGSAIGSIGALVFRLMTISILPSDEYVKLALLIRSLEFIISFVGFELHKPLTRNLVIGKYGVNKTVNSFIWNYRISSLLGIIIFSGVLTTLVIDYSLNVIILSIVGLMVWAYIEYFTGISRGLDQVRKASLLASLPGLFRGLLVFIPYLINNLQFESYILIYVISLILTSLIGAVIAHPYWKSIFSTQKIETPTLIENYKESFYLFYGQFNERGFFWLITNIASRILPSDVFKLFDLMLIIVSLTGIISSNLGLALIQQLSTIGERKWTKKTVRYIFLIIIIGFVLNFIFYLVMLVTKVDYKLFQFMNLNVSLGDVSSVRLFYLIPIFMITASISSGLLQAEGKFSFHSKFYLISSPIVLTLCAISFYQEIIELLPASLILNKAIISTSYLVSKFSKN